MLESHLHITCQEVVDLVTDWLEGALPSEEAALFEMHLNFCEGCVWYVDQIRKTASLAGHIREEEVPPEVRARLITAFRDWKSS
jgi:hypothetical protein